jgi:PTS system nitrogen regulatory IIA component
MENAVNLLNIPTPVAKSEIISALLARESMMSTAIGHGVAIPHPQHPIIADTKNASVSICFTRQPIDFRALDAQPVHVLFIVLTHSPKRHLEILAKLTYLCQLDAFLSMLHQQAAGDEIMAFVEEKQREWNRREQL